MNDLLKPFRCYISGGGATRTATIFAGSAAVAKIRMSALLKPGERITNVENLK